MQLILASKSPARQATLQNAGINFVTEVSYVNEAEIIKDIYPINAEIITTMLSAAKAQKIKESLSPKAMEMNSFILGCDTVFEFDGKVYGKPKNKSEAIANIKTFSGGQGVLFTGHCLIDLAQNRTLQKCARTNITFAELSDLEIERYVKTEEPLHVAGSFTVDGFGGAFVKKITGDYHNIVGLSLPLLRKMVIELGYYYPDLWR